MYLKVLNLLSVFSLLLPQSLLVLLLQPGCNILQDLAAGLLGRLHLHSTQLDV